MVKDDERREVARRLRGNPEDTLIPHRTGRHHGMGCREAADRFWNMCDRIKAAGNYDIAFSTTSVLADLIEPSCDRERLLAIAAVMAKDSIAAAKQDVSVMPPYILHQARYIAESCGETLASIRSHDVQELGVSIIPGEAIVDHDALLALADEMEQVADGNRLTGLMAIGRAWSWADRIREACGEVSR